MEKYEEKKLNLWLTWNYEREQQRLDRLSEQGKHLVKPGLFRSSYTQDSTVRYVYRLDYQPEVRRKSALKDYLDLYTDAGWEYLGQCQGWHYFRQLWIPGKVLEIYTDRDSLKQHYRRIQRVLGVVLIAELLIMFVNMNNFLHLPSGRHLLPAFALLFVLLVVVVCMLSYGCFAVHRKVKEIEKN